MQRQRIFTLDAGEVILSAGSLNSTEILLRSEMHGLSVSPALGTKFSGNGDFFGLAYNGGMRDRRAGIRRRRHVPGPAIRPSPGRTSSGVVRYTAGLPEAQRITVEDFSFPRAYVEASQGRLRPDPRRRTPSPETSRRRATAWRATSIRRTSCTIPTAP